MLSRWWRRWWYSGQFTGFLPSPSLSSDLPAHPCPPLQRLKSPPAKHRRFMQLSLQLTTFQLHLPLPLYCPMFPSQNLTALEVCSKKDIVQRRPRPPLHCMMHHARSRIACRGADCLSELDRISISKSPLAVVSFCCARTCSLGYFAPVCK
jgi:hypothetical protein